MNSLDQTLYDLALEGDVKAVTEFLDKNPKALVDTPGESTPLMAAAAEGHESVVEVLLVRKANPNAINKTGDTALSLAAANGAAGCVTSLLNNKADLKVGNPAINSAAYYGQLDVCELLLENGAAANSKHKGFTALYAAVDQGHAAVCKTLIKFGADVKLKSGKKNRSRLRF